MPNGFQDIARKLAAATITPSTEAAELEKIGAGLTTGIRAEIEPFRKLEKAETAAGEYAASPYRMNLAKQVGRKDWADLANRWEKVRNEYLTFKPAQTIREPKMKKTSVTFDAGFLQGMKEGTSIQIGDTKIWRNTAGSKTPYAFQRSQDKTPVGSGGKSEHIIKHFGKKTTKEVAIPGQFEERRADATGRTKDEIETEMKNLRIIINRVIASKSELERMAAAYKPPIGGGLGVGRPGLSKLGLEKFKSADRFMKDILAQDKGTMEQLERISGDIPFSSIQGYVIDYLKDLNFGLTNKAIEDGKWASIRNATINSFRELDENLVDQNLQIWRSNINRSIDVINGKDVKDPRTGKIIKGLKKPSEKAMASMALLLKIAPTAGDPGEAVVGAIGEQMLIKSFARGVSNPAVDLIGGMANLPRYQDDYNNMARIVLQKRSPGFKTTIEKKGQNLWFENLNNIRKNIPSLSLPKKFLTRGTTPDTIRDIIRDNLISNPQISKFAPTTRAALNKALKDPTPSPQRKWIVLFKTIEGRDPSFSDIRKMQTVKRKAAEARKGAEVTAGILKLF